MCQGETVIVQEKESELVIKDADSDVIFMSEETPLTMEEYIEIKELALKSAADFLKLYESVPDKNISVLPIRKTFYDFVPRTVGEMYLHTKNVNSYYLGEYQNKGYGAAFMEELERVVLGETANRCFV